MKKITIFNLTSKLLQELINEFHEFGYEVEVIENVPLSPDNKNINAIAINLVPYILTLEQNEWQKIYDADHFSELFNFINQQESIKITNHTNVNLTPQEYKILQLLSLGLKNREIATEIHTGIRNVEKFVSSLLEKTGLRNRTELARWAISLEMRNCNSNGE